MAEIIESSIKLGKHCLIEAGTGTGKSLAYLIPVINYVVDNDTKVIVSTYTKALQEQLVKKDLPFLHKVYKDQGVEFKYALSVGSENYVCRRRWEKVVKTGLLPVYIDPEEVNRFVEWVQSTKTGLRLDLEFKISPDLWKIACRESDFCLHNKCPEFNNCYFHRALDTVMKANVIVCNHHMFFLNLHNPRKFMPSAEVIVFDEAHTVEEVAVALLGLDFSLRSLKRVTDSIYNPASRRGILSRMEDTDPEWVKHVRSDLGSCERVIVELLNEWVKVLGTELTIKRIREPLILPGPAVLQLKHLQQLINTGVQYSKTWEDEMELRAIAERIDGLIHNLEAFCTQCLDGYVYWIESEIFNHIPTVKLYAAPVDVAKILRDELFEELPVVILTSATITVNKSFEYFKNRIGLTSGKVVELLLDSPFDYENNVVLYTPQHFPRPDGEDYASRVGNELVELLKFIQGRMLVLSTSYSFMRGIHKLVKEGVENSGLELKLLIQGQGEAYKLVDKFKSHPGSVLFGTDTFWQGVDIPGDDLLCVAITRLPFAVPTHPIIEARGDLIREAGGEPFKEYQLPEAILMFRQGFGRLVRTINDWGIIAVFDPRIQSLWYGKLFLQSLPKVRVVHRIEEVQDFFAAKHKA